jgi:hypothetical protein
MHLESISNGLGAPSLLLLIMAIRKEIPATVSISADTGWENDRVWNTGRRSTNRQYFDEVIVPLCKGSHVTPRFVRTVDENKLPLDGLRELVIQGAPRATYIPLFGSKGGRQIQSCTDKMKIRAIHQEERRLGAKTVRNAQGIHFYEADRRTKGRFLRMDGQWSIYQSTLGVSIKDPVTGEKRTVQKDIKWQTHYYPLVDLKLSREEIYKAVEKEGVPYLISSECDLCPHQDLARWERKSKEVIEDGARIEALFNGKYFFTPLRIPLKEAIAEMQRKREQKDALNQDIDFGCSNAICGV